MILTVNTGVKVVLSSASSKTVTPVPVRVLSQVKGSKTSETAYGSMCMCMELHAFIYFSNYNCSFSMLPVLH